jgi:hypothetical protein
MRDAEYAPAVGSRGVVKRAVFIIFGTLVLLTVGLMYSVWRESQAPINRTPGPLENGRTQLHTQLEEAKKTEGAAEKQNWDSPEHLRAFIEGHQQRIEKLKDNKEAAEIVAYDRDAIDRLEKRIAQIADEEAAKAEAAKEAAKEAAQAAKQAAQQAQQP